MHIAHVTAPRAVKLGECISHGKHGLNTAARHAGSVSSPDYPTPRVSLSFSLYTTSLLSLLLNTYNIKKIKPTPPAPSPLFYTLIIIPSVVTIDSNQCFNSNHLKNIILSSNYNINILSPKIEMKSKTTLKLNWAELAASRTVTERRRKSDVTLSVGAVRLNWPWHPDVTVGGRTDAHTHPPDKPRGWGDGDRLQDNK